jgi:hypothetical protein
VQPRFASLVVLRSTPLQMAAYFEKATWKACGYSQLQETQAARWAQRYSHGIGISNHHAPSLSLTQCMER